MSQAINYYSTLWIAAALVTLAALFVFRHKPKVSDLVALGVVIVGLVIGWTTLHPTQTPLMDDAKKVQAMLGQGTPMLLEFQSPY